MPTEHTAHAINLTAPDDETVLTDLILQPWNDRPTGTEPMDISRANSSRAATAALALTTYITATRSTRGTQETPLREALGDFLCDLRHLTDAAALDWPTLLEAAEMHYSAEILGG